LQKETIKKFIITYGSKISYCLLGACLVIIILLIINIPLQFWDDSLSDIMDKIVNRTLMIVGINTLLFSAVIKAIVANKEEAEQKEEK